MQNILGTCLAIGILAGGFVVTGDLPRLANRAARILTATDVPDDDAPIPAAPPGGPAPVARRPRTGGLRRIELAATRPGERILVWLDAAADPLPVDVVDPGRAAVILHRGTPSRVAVVDGVLATGRPFHVVPLGLAHGGAAAADSLGTISGLQITP